MGEYIDEAAHSDTVDRENLKRLCHDIADGKIKILLLNYHDRLGRGSVFAKLVEWLKAWNVRIVCGDIPETSDATDMLLSFYGAQGGLFLKTLRSRTKEGIARAQQAGKHVGNSLLGFEWKDGKWVPYPWAEILETTPRLGLKPWQRKRVLEAVRAYREGHLDDLIRSRTEGSKSRYIKARRNQEIKAREFEAWLLEHRPLTMDRVSL